jgi:hypothetical protein
MLPDDVRQARVLLSTELDRTGDAMHAVMDLRPAEGVILEVPRQS